MVHRIISKPSKIVPTEDWVVTNNGVQTATVEVSGDFIQVPPRSSIVVKEKAVTSCPDVTVVKKIKIASSSAQPARRASTQSAAPTASAPSAPTGVTAPSGAGNIVK